MPDEGEGDATTTSDPGTALARAGLAARNSAGKEGRPGARPPLGAFAAAASYLLSTPRKRRDSATGAGRSGFADSTG